MYINQNIVLIYFRILTSTFYQQRDHHSVKQMAQINIFGSGFDGFRCASLALQTFVPCSSSKIVPSLRNSALNFVTKQSTLIRAEGFNTSSF